MVLAYCQRPEQETGGSAFQSQLQLGSPDQPRKQETLVQPTPAPKGIKVFPAQSGTGTLTLAWPWHSYSAGDHQPARQEVPGGKSPFPKLQSAKTETGCVGLEGFWF